MEQWKKDVIEQKLENADRQMFSLEVDLRVTRRIGNKKGEEQVVKLIKELESAIAALEEELVREDAHARS